MTKGGHRKENFTATMTFRHGRGGGSKITDHGCGGGAKQPGAQWSCERTGARVALSRIRAVSPAQWVVVLSRTQGGQSQWIG